MYSFNNNNQYHNGRSRRKYESLMSKIMLISILFLISGCKANNKENDSSIEDTARIQLRNVVKRDSSVNIEKQENDSTNKVISNVMPDTTINKKLLLREGDSIHNFYSDSKSLELVERLRESAVIVFRNKSNNEYLLAYHYEGDTEYTYSCFEIGYLKNDKNISKSNFYQTHEDVFQTESGLSLGMPLNEVFRLKGEQYQSKKQDNFTILTFKITNINNSPFLKRYSMPSYFIEIWAAENEVKKIVFGFEYP